MSSMKWRPFCLGLNALSNMTLWKTIAAAGWQRDVNVCFDKKSSSLFKCQTILRENNHYVCQWIQAIVTLVLNSPHNGQWRGALMLFLFCARMNGWENNRDADDLRPHSVHYDVTNACVSGCSATMVLRIEDKLVNAFNEEWFQWPPPFRCWQITAKPNIFYLFCDKIITA